MIAVLSATEDDLYAMPLPFVVYSWLKLGAEKVIVFHPYMYSPKLELASRYCSSTDFFSFSCEEKRVPTYSQVIRLFGASAGNHLHFYNNVSQDDFIITGDSDMCVFGNIFDNLDKDKINIVGNDLTPPEQVPICFLGMKRKIWWEVMDMWEIKQKNGYKEGKLKTPQECVSALIDPIEGINIRGEQWSFDQWYAKNKISESGKEVCCHPRSNGITQFAQKRADRDGWHFDPYNIIDAHLPRPLTNKENFDKVYDLFKIKYPNDDLQWMINFRDEYMKL